MRMAGRQSPDSLQARQHRSPQQATGQTASAAGPQGRRAVPRRDRRKGGRWQAVIRIGRSGEPTGQGARRLFHSWAAGPVRSTRLLGLGLCGAGADSNIHSDAFLFDGPLPFLGPRPAHSLPWARAGPGGWSPPLDPPLLTDPSFYEASKSPPSPSIPRGSIGSPPL